MSGNNWWVDAGSYNGMPGGTAVGGGGDTSVVMPRDPLDAKRMANGLAPGASYPDGYLGTITDRREDRLLGAVQSRLTDRSYQRGVHKGEKLGTDSYYWTADCNPQMGLQRQSMARPADQEGATVLMTQRHTPVGNPVENLTALGNSAALSPEQQMQVSKQFGVDPAQNPLPMATTDPDRYTRMMQTNMLPRTR